MIRQLIHDVGGDDAKIMIPLVHGFHHRLIHRRRKRKRSIHIRGLVNDASQHLHDLRRRRGPRVRHDLCRMPQPLDLLTAVETACLMGVEPQSLKSRNLDASALCDHVVDRIPHFLNTCAGHVCCLCGIFAPIQDPDRAVLIPRDIFISEELRKSLVRSARQ